MKLTTHSAFFNSLLEDKATRLPWFNRDEILRVSYSESEYRPDGE